MSGEWLTDEQGREYRLVALADWDGDTPCGLCENHVEGCGSTGGYCGTSDPEIPGMKRDYWKPKPGVIYQRQSEAVDPEPDWNTVAQLATCGYEESSMMREALDTIADIATSQHKTTTTDLDVLRALVDNPPTCVDPDACEDLSQDANWCEWLGKLTAAVEKMGGQQG